jgi:small subunit ribosomal protein S1
LHISELGKDLKHASMAVKEGDELDVVIERVDPKQRRISLSKLSAAEAKAVEEGALDLSARPKSLKPGSHVTVVIDKVEHNGMQVQVRGVLGRRGRGYLPNRELGTLSGEQRRNLQPGAEIEVKVVGTDRDGGLRVSIKGKEVDEERKAVREYRKESAKQGLGTFGDLLRQKLQQTADGSGDQ